LRVGASATDDASTSRLVKQLYGASIRHRVSRRLLFSVFHNENDFSIGVKFSMKSVKESINYTLEMQCICFELTIQEIKKEI